MIGLGVLSSVLVLSNVVAVAQQVPASAVPLVQTQTFTVKDLGGVEVFNQSIVPGLGPRGDVVLWSRNVDGQFTPIHWKDGASQAFNVPPGYSNAFAYGLDGSGTAIGWANTSLNPVDSLSTKHAFRFLADKAEDLGTLPGGRNSEAYAISNRGAIVGISDVRGNHRQGFEWAAGHMHALPPLRGGQDAGAYGVNTKGYVAGVSSKYDAKTKRFHMHAVVWRDGRPIDLHATDDDDDSVAFAVNSRGDTVGRIASDDENEAFLYSNYSIRRLGVQGSAFSINDRSEIVGTIDAPERGRSAGFLWRNGNIYNLNESIVGPEKPKIEAAFSINNEGLILCLARFPGGMHIVLLSPSTMR